MTVLLVTIQEFKDLQKGNQRVVLGGDEKRYSVVCGSTFRFQQNTYFAIFPISLLQHLSISKSIWEDLMMDFIEGLPKSKG